MTIAPVFLRPVGRSGGTLFVTMLDAHPEMAMSYEIYEDRLLDGSGKPMDPQTIADELEQCRPADDNQDGWIKALADRNLQVFMWRARRAGLDVDEVLTQIQQFAEASDSLETIDSRLELIDRLMIYKMTKLGKTVWGGKAAVDPRALHNRHPDASFFIMVRDGRDILASRLNTGDFETDPRKVAHEWVEMLNDFHAFASQSNVRAMEVRYEQLVHEPELVLREVCDHVGVGYSPLMLSYHERDMSLFRNPYGHLSHNQIARGLNAHTIGRWRRDLSAEQVDAFCEVAGDLLDKLGYLSADSQTILHS